MLEIPVLRWGKPYESLEKQDIVHVETGEVLAKMHQANGGLLNIDMRQANRARNKLREIPVDKLIELVGAAADLFLSGTLPLGNGTQTPEQFCEIQSATTGLPVVMCAGNMKKNHFVLKNMRQILDALTRGLPLDILSRGYGSESRGVMLSYQANSPVLGMVLPSNSPGVHALWLPVIPMQIGLVIKPGSQEPWTAYRMAEAFFQVGIPRESISIYPGGHDVGNSVLQSCRRAMIFGGAATIEKYAGNPAVQVHGPGFSKIVFGDDEVDNWEKHLDTLCDSVLLNGGRSCINVSSIWASRHTAEIAEAIAKRIGPVAPPTSLKDPGAKIAAFTVQGQADAISGEIDEGVKAAGATEVTEKYRGGPRLVKHDRFAYLRPTVVHCSDPEPAIAKAEYMFPFVSVVECPQDKMLANLGPTLVCTALTKDEKFQQQLLDATNIDRLNFGDIKTTALNWLQPHEGNIVEFLYRARAFQNSPPPLVG